MCELVFSLQEFLKIVPGIAIFPLSFYLAWKKIGNSVSCSISMESNRISAPRINTVTLTNYKDRPVTIFGIQAVVENDITYTVDEFDPPLILKALETINVSTSRYSTLMVGDSKWELNLIEDKKIEIFLITDSGVVKCKFVDHPTFKKIAYFDSYTTASKSTKKFNGVVYNENAKYAITYTNKSDSKIRTAIVDFSGFITNDWDYRFNLVPYQQMQSVSDVRAYLAASKADVAFNIYGVDELA